MKSRITHFLSEFPLLLVAAIALAGCMANSGTITHAPVAHFAFVGETRGAALVIDDQPPVALDGDGQSVQTEPGKHRIRVTKGDRVVIDREVLIGDRQTMEISVP